ncbi:MAG TPA: HD domain-containing protein [Dehalococcoidia bacterium]|nr:HD domain-containing protein [Dehalococcoidia bacterium]
MSANGAGYRVGQFRRAVGAHPGASQLATARTYLTPSQWRLFGSMAPRDQWHAIETWRLLGDRGRRDRDLALAALLHDAGKGYIRLHERVLFVLIARWPWLLRRLAAPRGARWRTALYRTARHAATGARLASAAGAGERAIALIRYHHRVRDAVQADDPDLLALIEADARA